ncbi:DUF2934 domain-containing protein [Mesorhizobium sp. RP14(2022)]|uniref:DUF2934 domain-containing protein n=1 Tax=Mesorhizobium liriopis TaxID=2953882 RepID=A0ABT1C808_9HYPH|nr:DUF2934 domain-containing protein [Mesorhizobium liriopis]MCO6050967.1 DUF2934 domain-containing protein [Mesorhizobium liriopis]
MSDQGREDRIRSRAYGKWESEGRQDGHHDRHWDEASREVDGEGDGLPADATPSDVAPASETDETSLDAAGAVERDDAPARTSKSRSARKGTNGIEAAGRS